MNTSSNEDKSSNNLPSDYTELDLEKIREFITILEEHQKKCEEEENFLEAEVARDRIGEFKKIEEAKLKLEASKEFENQKIMLEKEQKEELLLFNQKFDQEYDLLIKSFEQQEAQLVDKHEKELAQSLQEYDDNYQKKPKPSSELLNWIKKKEISIKQKEYQKAHDANAKIDELTEKEYRKYNEDKEKNIEIEHQRIVKKQEVEVNGFVLKKKSVLVTFNKTKEAHLDILTRKYKSRLNELDNYQKLELSNFNKILKGLSKPNSRIKSIMKSASSYKPEINSL